MNFFKNKKGFTLVELVVVIAILGILAGIAIPRFMDATASARGAKVVADMRTIESAASMYYAKNGTFPALQADIDTTLLAAWPTPPTGDAKIKTYANTDKTITVKSTDKYVYAYDKNAKTYTLKLGDNTLAGLLGS